MQTLEDTRALRFLSRDERRFLKSIDKTGGEKMSLVDVTVEVHAKNEQGEEIKNGKGTVPTLREVALICLRRADDGGKTTPQEKRERGLLARRIEKQDQIEFSRREVEVLKHRIGVVMLDPDVVVECESLLADAVEPTNPEA